MSEYKGLDVSVSACDPFACKTTTDVKYMQGVLYSRQELWTFFLQSGQCIIPFNSLHLYVENFTQFTSHLPLKW